MCEPLYDHRDWLWTFLDVEGVEPTNNVSERALRPAVIWRKLSFGTQSAKGSRFVETILTVVETCHRQSRNSFEYPHRRHAGPLRRSTGSLTAPQGVNGYQGGQVRAQVDEALLPHISGQPDSFAALRPGLQPRQLPAQAGFAETGATLVADDAAGKADQDRSEDRATRPLRDVPDGRSGDPTPAVPGDSAKYRTAQGDTAMLKPE